MYAQAASGEKIYLSLKVVIKSMMCEFQKLSHLVPHIAKVCQHKQ